MTIRLRSYLKRNRFGVYYFRRVIPRDLKPYFAFRQLSRSTCTRDPREAQCLALRFGASIDLLFSRIREMAKKGDPEPLRQDWIAKLDFDADGTIKSVITEGTAEEADAVARVMPELIKAAQTGAQPAGRAPEAKFPLLFDQIDKYLDEQARGAGWTEQTVQDVRGDFEQFKAILGNVPISKLGHESLNDLRDILMQLPANINKSPATRGQPIDLILGLGLPPQSPSTVNKKWGRLITFFTWLENKGLVDRNYAAGKKPKAKPRSREKFSNGDLKALFESDEYRNGRFDEAFKYWLPLLSLYTGARLEELAQLHLADFRRVDDIDLIEITDEVDEESGASTSKRVKTESSRRVVPIHQALVEAGLLRFVERLKELGYDRLFPELQVDSVSKVGPRASEWFTEYRRSKGVGAAAGHSTKTFHSFRHTMNWTLQKAGVAQEMREALCGHTSKSINISVYGGTLPAKMLADVVGKLNYEIEIFPYTANAAHETARKRSSSSTKS